MAQGQLFELVGLPKWAETPGKLNATEFNTAPVQPGYRQGKMFE